MKRLALTLLTSGILAPLGAWAQAPLDPEVRPLLSDFFARAVIGEPVAVEDLRLFPITRIASSAADLASYLPADRALGERVVVVREHEGGTVQTLELSKTRSQAPVFLTGGEILSGAKQDRILSQDVLLPVADGSYLLNVYCVEQGRWVHTSDRFETREALGTAKLRKSVAKKSGQGEVWGEVSAKSRAMEVSSPTQAMMANYDSPKTRARVAAAQRALGDAVAALFAEQELIGAVITVRGEIISLDAFRNEALFAALWPKLAKASALDALDPSFDAGVVTKADVDRFVRSLADATLAPVANPGIGLEIAIASAWASGTAHLSDHGVNHVNLFPEGATHKGRIY